MKNTIRQLGIIALVAVIALCFTACPTEADEDDPLNGTWVAEGGSKMVLDNGGFTWLINNVEMAKGTYSTNGSNMTMTYTQISGAAVGLDASSWYTKEKLIQHLISEGNTSAEAEEMYNATFGPQTVTYTLNDNTLTFTIEGTTVVYTRQ